MRGARTNTQLRETIRDLKTENAELRGLVKQYMQVVEVLKAINQRGQLGD
jgi:hypothetical protein